MRGPQTAGSWTTPEIIQGGSLSLEGALATWASADRGAVVGMLVAAFGLSKGLMGAAFSGWGGGGSLAVWLAVVAVITGVGGCSGGGPHDGGDGEEDGGSATADAPPVPAGDGGRGGAGGAARDLLRLTPPLPLPGFLGKNRAERLVSRWDLVPNADGSCASAPIT